MATSVVASGFRRATGGAAAHLGIGLAEYDERIRTFIPHYEEMLDTAASALRLLDRRTPRIVDLGTGSGALAARSLRATRGGRVIGVDSDAAMLQVARRRVGRRLTPVVADFTAAPLPRCDAITASFSLHHVRTRARKRALYRRCAAALPRGGVLVTADCFLASDARIRRTDRQAWLRHLRHWYSARQAGRYLRAWAREDVYFELIDELAMLAGARLATDVIWRRDSFAVIVATKHTSR